MAPKPIYKNAVRTTVVMEEETFNKIKAFADKGHGGYSRWAARQLDQGFAIGSNFQWDPELYRWVSAQSEALGMTVPEFLTTVLQHSLQQAFQHVQKQHQQEQEECLVSPG